MAVQSDRQVIVSISADVSELRRGLQQVQQSLNNQRDSVNQLTNRMGHSFEKMFMYGMMVKMAFDTATKVIGETVKAFATLESIGRKFNTVFSDSRGVAKEFIETLSMGTGIATGEIMRTVNNMGDLAIGMGVNEKATAQMSMGLTQLAYDLAQYNFGQMTTEDALRNMNSAMLGNGMAAKSLGISLTEPMLKLALLHLGLNQNYDDLDEGTKMLVRYTAMWQQTRVSQGYAIDNADTLAGTMTRLATTMQSAKETVGGALAPAYVMFAQVMMASVVPSIINMSKSLGQFFTSVANGGPAMYLLIGTLSALTGVITFMMASWLMAKFANVGASITLTMTTIREAMAIAFLNRNISGAIVHLRSLAINTRALTLGFVAMGASIYVLITMFKKAKTFKLPKIDPPRMIDPKELQKLFGDTTSTLDKGAKKHKSYAEQVAEAEKKLNQEIKKQIKERQKAYSDLGKFMQGVDRQTLGMNNIIKGARSSADALKDFNGAVRSLQDRIGNSDLGRKFLAELNQLDPDQYVDYVRSLASASDGQLKEIIELWGQRHKEAGIRATEEIKAKAPEIKETIYQSIKVEDTVLDNLGATMAQGVAEGITEGFDGVSDDVATQMRDSMDESLIGGFGDTQGMLVGAVLGASIGGAVGAYFGGPAGAQLGMQLGGIVGGAIGNAFGDYFRTGWTDWKKSIDESIRKLRENFTNNEETWGIGIAIVAGIIEGLGRGAIQIVNGLWKVLVEPIIKGVKDLFGIHSPSTVMRDQVGKYLSMGIIEGITTTGLWTKVSEWKTTLLRYFGSISLESIGKMMSDTLHKGLESVTKISTNIGSGIKTTFIGIVNSVINAFNALIRGINETIQINIPQWVPKYGGSKWGMNLPQIKTYANGGIVDKATLGIFGEAGTEANIPLGNMNKMRPFAEAVASMMGDTGGGLGVTVENLYVREESDIKKIAEQLYSLAKRDRRAFGLR